MFVSVVLTVQTFSLQWVHCRFYNLAFLWSCFKYGQFVVDAPFQVGSSTWVGAISLKNHDVSTRAWPCLVDRFWETSFILRERSVWCSPSLALLVLLPSLLSSPSSLFFCSVIVFLPLCVLLVAALPNLRRASPALKTKLTPPSNQLKRKQKATTNLRSSFALLVRISPMLCLVKSSVLFVKSGLFLCSTYFWNIKLKNVPFTELGCFILSGCCIIAQFPILCAFA